MNCLKYRMAGHFRLSQALSVWRGCWNIRRRCLRGRPA